MTVTVVYERCGGSDCLPNGDACHWCGGRVSRYGEDVYGAQYPAGSPLRGRLRPHDAAVGVEVEG